MGLSISMVSVRASSQVVFFKFDGIAGGQFSKGADKYAGEVDSLIKLVSTRADLLKER